jgi:hypothetical protein
MIMSISMETKKAEAIKRMKALDLYKPYITLFEKENKIFLSEMTGGVYEFNDNTELVTKVKEFEEEYDALVYHVIRTMTQFGELYNFLYVSKYEEEWEMDNEDISEGYALAYVWNKTDEWCSEFGSIGVQGKFGGIVRVA